MLDVVMYPKFFDCSQLTDDIFWKSVFEELAYGRCPYGTYITRDFFCCNFKNKEFSYKIDIEKNADVLYNDILTLLTKKFGLMSNVDKVEKRKRFRELEQTIQAEQQKDWDQIKKKNIKQFLIYKYILHNQQRHKLSTKQVRFLLSIIILGLLFKTLHVECKDGNIRKIEGLKLVRGYVNVDKTVLQNRDANPIVPKIIVDKTNLSNEWYKYVSQVKQAKRGKLP
tara:strand:+ start:11 stop:685 length:675 start_codon:yes stop_codon:yes gene_type:complete